MAEPRKTFKYTAPVRRGFRFVLTMLESYAEDSLNEEFLVALLKRHPQYSLMSAQDEKDFLSAIRWMYVEWQNEDQAQKQKEEAAQPPPSTVPIHTTNPISTPSQSAPK